MSDVPNANRVMSSGATSSFVGFGFVSDDASRTNSAEDLVLPHQTNAGVGPVNAADLATAVGNLGSPTVTDLMPPVPGVGVTPKCGDASSMEPVVEFLDNGPIARMFGGSCATSRTPTIEFVSLQPNSPRRRVEGAKKTRLACQGSWPALDGESGGGSYGLGNENDKAPCLLPVCEMTGEALSMLIGRCVREAVASQVKELLPQLVRAVGDAHKKSMASVPAEVVRALRDCDTEAPVQATISTASRLVPPRRSGRAGTNMSRSASDVSKMQPTEEVNIKALERDLAQCVLVDSGLTRAKSKFQRNCTPESHRHPPSIASAAPSLATSQMTSVLPSHGGAGLGQGGRIKTLRSGFANDNSSVYLDQPSGGTHHTPFTYDAGQDDGGVVGNRQSIFSETVLEEADDLAYIHSERTLGSMGTQLRSSPFSQLQNREIFNMRIQELTDEVCLSATGSADVWESVDCAKVEAPMILRLCGLLPWSTGWPWFSTCYTALVPAIAVLAAAVPPFEQVEFREGLSGLRPSCTIKPCYGQHGLYVDVIVAFAAIAAILSIVLQRAMSAQCLAATLVVLRNYTWQKACAHRWEKQAKKDQWLTLILWVAVVTMCLFGLCSDGDVTWRSVAHAASMCISSGVLLSVTFCIVYLCRALTMMVEMFCGQVTCRLVLSEAVHEWNLLQAVLRTTCNCIQVAFLCIAVAIGAAAPLVIVDVHGQGIHVTTLTSLLPSLFVLVGMTRTIFIGASISESCSRVPSLINSLSFGPGLERARQHTIDYIVSSAAGFYINDVRLNTEIIMKFMYTWVVIAIGLSSTLNL